MKTWTNIPRYRPRQLRLKRRRLLKAIKPMPLVMTISLPMTLLTMTLLIMTLLIMKHSRHPNGRPTMLKNPRTSTRNHTKPRNRTTNILPPPMYIMLLCLY